MRIEKLKTAIIWKLPKWMIYWAIIRAATKDESGYPGDAVVNTMLKRFKP
jgi:hypothetical protein